MDAEVLQRMEATEWPRSWEDAASLEELRSRIEECGRQRGLISYSDLVVGVQFLLPSLWHEPRTIDIHNWSGLDRAILGDFLGCISTESYRHAGFMASALVVGKHADQPSPHFFEWMEQLQILPNLNRDTVLRFWVEQVRLAHVHYMGL